MNENLNLTYDKWSREHTAILTENGRTVKGTGRTQDEATMAAYDRLASVEAQGSARALVYALLAPFVLAAILLAIAIL